MSVDPETVDDITVEKPCNILSYASSDLVKVGNVQNDGSIIARHDGKKCHSTYTQVGQCRLWKKKT